jgi:hypothetical protein
LAKVSGTSKRSSADPASSAHLTACGRLRFSAFDQRPTPACPIRSAASRCHWNHALEHAGLPRSGNEARSVPALHAHCCTVDPVSGPVESCARARRRLRQIITRVASRPRGSVVRFAVRHLSSCMPLLDPP